MFGTAQVFFSQLNVVKCRNVFVQFQLLLHWGLGEPSCFYPHRSTTELKIKYDAWIEGEEEKASDQNEGMESMMESVSKAQGLKFNSLIVLNFLMARWWCHVHHSSQKLQSLITNRLLRNVKIGNLRLEVIALDLDQSDPPDLQAVSLPWTDQEGTWFDIKLMLRGTSVIKIRPTNYDDESGDFRQSLRSWTWMFNAIASVALLSISTGMSVSSILMWYFLLSMVPMSVVIGAFVLSKQGKDRKVYDKVEHINYSARKGKFYMLCRGILTKTKFFLGHLLRKFYGRLSVVDFEAIVRINIPPGPSDRVWMAFAVPPECDFDIELYYSIGNRLLILRRFGILRPVLVLFEVFLRKKLWKQVLLNSVLPNMKDYRLSFLDPFPSINSL